jgi:5-methylcytosine-specific restriction endonuclease McrA
MQQRRALQIKNDAIASLSRGTGAPEHIVPTDVCRAFFVGHPVGGYMQIISRKNAIGAGELYYFTGIPCKRGHKSKRLVKNGSCHDCALLLRRPRYADEYQNRKEEIKSRAKQWRLDNPERAREYDMAKHQRKRDAELARMRARYEKNREADIERKRKAYRENVEENREKQRARYAENKEYFKPYQKARKARIRSSSGSFTAKEIKKMIKDQSCKCIYCKSDISKNYHADHIVPVSKGGSSFIENIQLLCPTCNLRKGAKMPEEFAKEIGILI